MSGFDQRPERLLRSIKDPVPGEPPHVYIVAELSANHNGDLSRALAIIGAAANAGADAVKTQTYTANSLTIDCRRDPFLIKGTPWAGRHLYELYQEAATPWEWFPRLAEKARECGVDLFSTPFDVQGVDLLESMGNPFYKVASFEIVDIPLLRKVASTGKPVILSTGMSTKEEIEEAVVTLQSNGAGQVVLLRCVSSYPAKHNDMNLMTLPDMARRFGRQVGLSDHSLEETVPVVATALGACLIEKHITLRRADGGPDSQFSLEPEEFRTMVAAVRRASQSLGSVRYSPSEDERDNLRFRRSIFVTSDTKKGEALTDSNIRVIRPGDGLHPRYFEKILGCTAVCDISAGTPFSWDLIDRKITET